MQPDTIRTDIRGGIGLRDGKKVGRVRVERSMWKNGSCPHNPIHLPPGDQSDLYKSEIIL